MGQQKIKAANRTNKTVLSNAIGGTLSKWPIYHGALLKD